MDGKEPEIFKTIAGKKVQPAKQREGAMADHKYGWMSSEARTVLEVLGFIALIAIGTEKVLAWLHNQEPGKAAVSLSSPVSVPDATVTVAQLEREKAAAALQHEQFNGRILSLEEGQKRIEKKVDSILILQESSQADLAVLKDRLPPRRTP